MYVYVANNLYTTALKLGKRSVLSFDYTFDIFNEWTGGRMRPIYVVGDGEEEVN